jgi:hypothetical protein
MDIWEYLSTIAPSSRAGEDRKSNFETFGCCLRHHLLLRNEVLLEKPHRTPYDFVESLSWPVSELYNEYKLDFRLLALVALAPDAIVRRRPRPLLGVMITRLVVVGLREACGLAARDKEAGKW